MPTGQAERALRSLPVRWWNFPLEYTVRCKRQFQRGLPFLGDLLGDDLVILLIAFALFGAFPFPTAAAIVLLGLSFWAVYEAGYFENDMVAALRERDPRIPRAFETFRALYSERRAWAWAGVFGLSGVAVAVLGAGVVPLSGGRIAPVSGMPEAALAVALGSAVWLAFLGVTRAAFRLYNAVDKLTRAYLYLPLQTLKYGFPALFFELPAAGAVLIFAQIMRRWLPYLVRRLSGSDDEVVPARLARLMVFIVIWLLLLPTAVNTTYLLQGALAAGFLMMRAANQTARQLAAVRRIEGGSWGVPKRPAAAGPGAGRPEPALQRGAR